MSAYEKSARVTIHAGICLSYTYTDPSDPSIEEPRIGYFDPSMGRLTALTEDEQIILSHFATSESYVRGLPDSTYP